ncbi:MAG: hypothetical protein R3282_03400 [Rhodothermales bacterium]|nr:hypothetical protein [Rhodothermales bacterium]
MDALISYRSLLLLNVAATWAMVGVILIVQLVHYPLFSTVGTDQFPGYEVQHGRRITWIVAPLMIVELLSAVGLLLVRPVEVPATWLWVGVTLVAVIWVSTAFVQVPLHSRLAEGFDDAAHAKLLATNWVRTVAWLLRGVLTILLLQQYLGIKR